MFSRIKASDLLIIQIIAGLAGVIYGYIAPPATDVKLLQLQAQAGNSFIVFWGIITLLILKANKKV